MKIKEILRLQEDVESIQRAVPRVIKATKGSFKKEQEFFTKNNGEQFTVPFSEFLKDKAWFDPPIRFGKKDAPYGRKLKVTIPGMMHAHLIKGRVLLFYKIEQDILILFKLCDHSDANNTAALLKNIKDIIVSDNWDIIPSPLIAAPQQTSPIIVNLFKEMTNNWEDMVVLRNFSKMTQANDPNGEKTGMQTYIHILGEELDPSIGNADIEELRIAAKNFIDQYNAAMRR